MSPRIILSEAGGDDVRIVAGSGVQSSGGDGASFFRRLARRFLHPLDNRTYVLVQYDQPPDSANPSSQPHIHPTRQGEGAEKHLLPSPGCSSPRMPVRHRLLFALARRCVVDPSASHHHTMETHHAPLNPIARLARSLRPTAHAAWPGENVYALHRHDRRRPSLPRLGRSRLRPAPLRPTSKIPFRGRRRPVAHRRPR